MKPDRVVVHIPGESAYTVDSWRDGRVTVFQVPRLTHVINEAMGKTFSGPAMLRGVEAARIGTDVHKWAEAPEAGIPTDPPVACAVRQLAKWFVDVAYAPLCAEVRMAYLSDDMSYGCTVDLVGYATIDNHRCLTLAELKTSKRIYGEHKIQVAAQWQALLDMPSASLPLLELPERALILRLPKVEGEEYEQRLLSADDLEGGWYSFQTLYDTWKAKAPVASPSRA